MKVDASEVFSFSGAKVAVLVGVGHGIGEAFLEELVARFPHLKIYATYRQAEFATPLLEFCKNKSVGFFLFASIPPKRAR